MKIVNSEMGRTLSGTAHPLHLQFDTALLDLDGVVYRGRYPVPHAVSVIRELRLRGTSVGFVTNNASRSRAEVAKRLTEMAVPTMPGEVLTSAQAAASLIAQDAGPATKVLPVGSDALRDALLAEGLRVVDSAEEDPTVVVQGMSTSLGWSDLAEAVYAINAGAAFVATNLDATVPTDRGVVLANGSMVAAVTSATGRAALEAGKPNALMFRQAAQRNSAERPLVVGDRLSGDIAGARAAGFCGLHVLTGLDGPADLLRATPSERPDYIGRDLRALLEAHPVPTLQMEGRWACKTAVASVRDGAVWLYRLGADHKLDEGGVLTLDELRAACVAAWEASDAAGGGNTVLFRSPTHLKLAD